MKSKNPMSLKDRLKNRAANHNIPILAIYQMYLIECFLDRLSKSPYKSNFIVKGGFLVSALTDLSQRTTMDLDTTCVGCDFEESKISQMMSEVCACNADDDFEFSVASSEPIRERSNYPGIRIHLTAVYEMIKAHLSIDVTSGDAITPCEVEFEYNRIFDDATIDLYSYSLETVLAEKLEAILALNIINTRPRDFYDIYLLSSTQTIDFDVLKEAFRRTCQRRHSLSLIDQFTELMIGIETSKGLQNQWERYRKQYPYANAISFSDVLERVKILFAKIFH